MALTQNRPWACRHHVHKPTLSISLANATGPTNLEHVEMYCRVLSRALQPCCHSLRLIKCLRAPFGIAWPLAKTGSAPTHMPIIPWPSGAQDTWHAHLCILPRILPDLGSPGLFHLWVLTMGTIVAMPRRSATLHRFRLAIVPVVGMHSGLCASSPSYCPMCGRGPRA